jgi:addiction module RelE/StbE family toxin
MQIEFSPEVKKELKKIKIKNLQLSKKVENKLLLFSQNPKHPSLRIHKITGKVEDRYSLSINKSIRLIYLLEGETAYLVAIGTHDQVYQK